MGGIDPNDIFNSFFGGMGNPFGRRNKPEKSDKEDIDFKMNVSFEDIYNGNKIKINYKRKVFCSMCDGTGCKDKKKHVCDSCNGTGQEVRVSKNGTNDSKSCSNMFQVQWYRKVHFQWKTDVLNVKEEIIMLNLRRNKIFQLKRE